jgi:hypothetical protein
MVIPEGWSVDIDQVEANHSSAKNKAVAPRPGGVRLHVTGKAHHASVVVRHARKRHWWWPWYRK